jgi:hypothetical protein
MRLHDLTAERGRVTALSHDRFAEDPALLPARRGVVVSRTAYAIRCLVAFLPPDPRTSAPPW